MKTSTIFAVALLSLTVAVSAANWDDRTVDYQWTGASGTIWDNSSANWTNNGSASAWVNIQPSAVFSGSVVQTGNNTSNTDPTYRHGTVYINPALNITLQPGQVLLSNNDYSHYNTSLVLADLGGGLYQLNRVNDKSRDGYGGRDGGMVIDMVAVTGNAALFSNVTGGVTVSGVQYVNTIKVTGSGNLTLSGGAGDSLWVAPSTQAGSDSIIADNSASVTFALNISNAVTGYGKVLSVYNRSTGTLAFSNNTIYGQEGIQFENNIDSKTIALNNVKLDSLAGANKNVDFRRGIFNLTGSNAKLQAGSVLLGNAGNTTLTVSDGAVFSHTFANNSQFYIGNGSGTSTLAVKGLLEAGDQINVGNNANATGILSVSGTGTVKLADNRTLSIASTGTGRVTVSDGGQLLTGAVSVGQGANSTGVFTVSGSAVYTATANGNLTIATGVNSTGTVILSGNSQSKVRDVYVGQNGVGVLHITENASLTTTDGQLIYVNANHQNNNTGIVLITGGTLSTRQIALGGASTTAQGTGTTGLKITGGELILRNANEGIHTGNYSDTNKGYESAKISENSFVIFGGGTITSLASWKFEMPATLSGEGGRIKFNTASNNTLTVTGTLDGAGGLEVQAGTLLLSGANTYEGGSIVSTGATLRTNETGVLGLGDVEVAAGATLWLGNAASLDSDATLSFAAGSTIKLDYNGTLTVSSLFNTSTGEYFNIGEYSLGDLGDLAALGNIFDFGTNAKLYISSIPEPSTWALILTGAALLAVCRRRRS